MGCLRNTIDFVSVVDRANLRRTMVGDGEVYFGLSVELCGGAGEAHAGSVGRCARQQNLHGE